ncbi:hypothetical protein M5D96_009670, partial [Drosophila gunungcola]
MQQSCKCASGVIKLNEFGQIVSDFIWKITPSPFRYISTHPRTTAVSSSSSYSTTEAFSHVPSTSV